MTSALSVQGYLKDPNVQKRIGELLDRRASQFTTSLLSAVNQNSMLAKCKPETVLNAALTAASMDLPINSSLGFAYIIPYGNEAQFQLGYKGIIQLAQRTGQYKTIGAATVYDGQLGEEDPLLGNVYNWSNKKSDTVLGYVSMFRLTNGFEKSLYMTATEMEDHAKRFSQTYKRGGGIWKDDFEAMALKTVIKMLISKFGPMSTELQTAVESDQSVIKDTGRIYVDNLSEEQEAEQKALEAIESAKDEDELTDIVTNLPADIQKLITEQATAKFAELAEPKGTK